MVGIVMDFNQWTLPNICNAIATVVFWSLVTFLVLTEIYRVIQDREQARREEESCKPKNKQ